ncbi:MAG: hypothetical protein KC517_03840 [Bacteroidetes bacterium]|jgi:hypothetical protein|nr:hypothetical protein [Bacteroidota bacterium]
MKSSQIKKLIALVVFVIVLAGSAYYMYNTLVKPSPYYPKDDIEQNAK